MPAEAARNVTLVNKERVVAYENTPNGVESCDRGRHGVSRPMPLIGADGIRSKIREQMTGGDPLRLSGHVAYRAVLPIEQMPEDLRWNAATLWAGPKCHISCTIRCRAGRPSIWSRPSVTDLENVGSNEPGKREEVLEQFRHIVPKARKLLEIPTELAALGAGRPRADRELDRRQRHAARRRRALKPLTAVVSAIVETLVSSNCLKISSIFSLVSSPAFNNSFLLVSFIFLEYNLNWSFIP